jgi:hypothetical protein
MSRRHRPVRGAVVSAEPSEKQRFGDCLNGLCERQDAVVAPVVILQWDFLADAERTPDLARLLQPGPHRAAQQG